MKDSIRNVLPEVDWIEDKSLQDKVLAAYERALQEGGWQPEDMVRIPFTLLKESGLTFADHVRAVTRIARDVHRTFQDVLGGKISLNYDILIAGALLHDVGKLLEIEEADGRFRKSSEGKVVRHPFSGAAIAYAEGLPPEVVHIIGAHSHEGSHAPRTPEGAIVHHADFICFDTVPA
ncbi:MAG: HD domain-containing protein [Candidatus Bipolaricaulota bacterium]